MRKKQEREYKELIPLLEEDISNCLYIYMDIVNGRKENADMEVWVQETDGDLELVLLRYYESFQIYGRKLAPKLEAVIGILKDYHPKMVSGQKNIIKNIEEILGDLYQAEYGCIYEINNKTRLERTCGVDLAAEADVEEIARLIEMDQSLGGHYSQKKLEMQLRNRIHTGTGRSYVIREKGKIVAHTASYAETEEYAIISGTIVHPAYRDRGYYSIISSHIIQKLKEEGKRIYTFAVNPRMMEYHDKMDDRRGSYGRLMLRK